MSKRSTVVVLERNLLESQAFYTLKGHAIIVLMAFMGKRQIEKIGHRGNEKKIIRNNGKIAFTYAEAKQKYGFVPLQFTRAIDQLIEHGFIDIAERGSALGKIPTLYSISSRWQNFGKPDFLSSKRIIRKIGIGFCKPN